MTKKFVKTDFKALMKKQEQPASTYTRTNDHSYRLKPRPSNQFQQRIQTTELRKYFQPLQPSTDVVNLIQKYPQFFTEVCLHPEPMRPYKNTGDSYGGNFRQYDRPPENEEIPEWESEGEVELGAKISVEIINKIQNVAPISLCELKPYEKEFLEEEIRRKQAEADLAIQLQATKPPNKTQNKQPLMKADSSSDEQVEIKKVIEIHQPPKQDTRNNEPQFVEDDDGDDDRFKDSSEEGSDDDIFGSGSDKDSTEKQDTKEQAKNQEVSLGHIKCAKGEFSMFALSQGIHEDEKIWSFASHNGDRVFRNLSSKQMDQNYVSIQSVAFPMVCFDENSNNYIPYALFHSTPDIKFFQTFNYTSANSNNYRRKKTNPGQNTYDYQQQPKQTAQEPAAGPAKNRKGSNNYRPKQPHI